MSRFALALVGFAALSACVGLSPEEEARAAEQVAATVISRVYPGANVAAMANCVRDHATRSEISTLASYRDQVVGGDAQVVTLAIIDRPETDACIRSNGIILG